MNKYEALEAMLEKIIQHGADIETVLDEFPEFAEELGPLLQSAIDANALAVPSASADVVRRGRTRLLQQAAQMRNTAPAPRASLFDFRLATVALGLVLALFVSGTGLVSASTSALPGDNLYPVKRGWENTQYWFADNDKIASLEAEHEEERREEVQELLGGGDLAEVRFEGVVTNIDGSKWEVAGVPVIVSDETDIENAIQIGSDVIVSGQTQSDGTVLAEMIVLSGHSEDYEEMPAEAPTEISTEASTIEEIDELVETETPELDDDEDEIEVTETPEPDDSDDGEGDDENTEQDDDNDGGGDGDDSEGDGDDDEPDGSDDDGSGDDGSGDDGSGDDGSGDSGEDDY